MSTVSSKNVLSFSLSMPSSLPGHTPSTASERQYRNFATIGGTFLLLCGGLFGFYTGQDLYTRYTFIPATATVTSAHYQEPASFFPRWLSLRNRADVFYTYTIQGASYSGKEVIFISQPHSRGRLNAESYIPRTGDRRDILVHPLHPEISQFPRTIGGGVVWMIVLLGMGWLLFQTRNDPS